MTYVTICKKNVHSHRWRALVPVRRTGNAR